MIETLTNDGTTFRPSDPPTNGNSLIFDTKSGHVSNRFYLKNLATTYVVAPKGGYASIGSAVERTSSVSVNALYNFVPLKHYPGWGGIRHRETKLYLAVKNSEIVFAKDIGLEGVFNYDIHTKSWRTVWGKWLFADPDTSVSGL